MIAAAKKADLAAIVTTPTDREIRTERTFDAPRERVWRAFTDPKLVGRWWGRGNEVVVERMEVERDGMRSAGMETGLNESYAALDELLRKA